MAIMGEMGRPESRLFEFPRRIQHGDAKGAQRRDDCFPERNSSRIVIAQIKPGGHNQNREGHIVG
jgi:hypothetical protein